MPKLKELRIWNCKMKFITKNCKDRLGNAREKVQVELEDIGRVKKRKI